MCGRQSDKTSMMRLSNVFCVEKDQAAEEAEEDLYPGVVRVTRLKNLRNITKTNKNHKKYIQNARKIDRKIKFEPKNPND